MKTNTEQKDKIAYPSCVLPMPGTPPITNRKQQIIRKKTLITRNSGTIIAQRIYKFTN